jgi:hypothetical protein
MGPQYRIWIQFKWSIGLMVEFIPKQWFKVHLPLVTISIGLNDDAAGTLVEHIFYEHFTRHETKP